MTTDHYLALAEDLRRSVLRYVVRKLGRDRFDAMDRSLNNGRVGRLLGLRPRREATRG